MNLDPDYEDTHRQVFHAMQQFNVSALAKLGLCVLCNEFRDIVLLRTIARKKTLLGHHNCAVTIC